MQKNRLKIIGLLLVISLTAVLIIVISIQKDEESNSDKHTSDESLEEAPPVLELPEETNNLITDLPSKNYEGWQSYVIPGDTREFKEYTKGVYLFDKENLCRMEEWKENDMCKFFNENYLIQFVNYDIENVIKLTIHVAKDEASFAEFMQQYNIQLGGLDKTDCKAKVLKVNNNQIYNFILSEGNNIEMFNNQIQSIIKDLNYETIYECI